MHIPFLLKCIFKGSKIWREKSSGEAMYCKRWLFVMMMMMKHWSVDNLARKHRKTGHTMASRFIRASMVFHIQWPFFSKQLEKLYLQGERHSSEPARDYGYLVILAPSISRKQEYLYFMFLVRVAFSELWKFQEGITVVTSWLLINQNFWLRKSMRRGKEMNS